MYDVKQRTKIDSSVSTWYDIITGVPQGSILDLHFNIFINYLFLFMKRSHVCNVADDNALHSCNKNISQIFQDLVYDVKNVINLKTFDLWFSEEVYPILTF